VVRAEMLRADNDLVQIALKQLGDHVSVLCGIVKEFIDRDRSRYARSCRRHDR